MERQPYLRDRLITQHPDGFYIIVPKEADPGIPICCPVCSTVMRTRDDESAFHSFGCCDRCSMVWAAPRRKEWAAGWRPDPQALREEVTQRPPLIVDLEVD